jgi:hypothetical protein
MSLFSIIEQQNRAAGLTPERLRQTLMELQRVQFDSEMKYFEENARELAHSMHWNGFSSSNGVWEARPDPPPPMDPPTKTAVLEREGGPDAEYCALAESIGLQTPEVLQTQLEAFLRENFIEVYDNEKVAAYMGNVIARESARTGKAYQWFWSSLRQSDAKMVKHANLRAHGTSHYRTDRYMKSIPWPVLQVIKLITDRFGDRVALFVSDYEETKPDPFLAVTAPRLPLYVIERWDEPSFRG